MGKKKSSLKNAASYYGGLTYAQFRAAGKTPLSMNDISWAGRMYPVSSYWWSRLSRLAQILLTLSVLGFLTIWIAVWARPHALLLVVYPDGKMMCAPHVMSASGAPQKLASSYKSVCDNLNSRTGRKWDLTATKSSAAAVGTEKTPPQNGAQ